MGVASLVLGIVGIVFSFIPCLGMYALFLTIPGVILGAIGLVSASKKKAPKGLAIAGLVCSIIGSTVAGYQYYVISEAVDSTTELGKAFSDLGKDLGNAIDEAAKEAQKNAEANK